MLAHLALAALLSGPATAASGPTITVASARNVTDAFGRVNCTITLAASNSSRHDISLTMAGSNASGEIGGVTSTRPLVPGPAPIVLLALSPVRLVQVVYFGPCLPTARYSLRLTANGRTLNHAHPAAGQPAVAGNRAMLGDLSAPFR